MRTESNVDLIVLDWLKEGLDEKIDQLLRALEDISGGAGGNELIFESLQAVKAIDAVLSVADYQLLRVMLKEQMSALSKLESHPDQADLLLMTVTESAWLLRAVLDRLSVGATVNALSLLPIINRLRQAQALPEIDAANVLARSAVLWSESRVFVKSYEGADVALKNQKLASNQLLASMEQQILRLMRGDVEAIPGLITTFDQIIVQEVNRAVVVATRSFEELLTAVHQDQAHYLPLAKRMIGRVLKLFRMEIQGRDPLLIRFEAIEFATDMLLGLVNELPEDRELCGERVVRWHEMLSTEQERARFMGLETSTLIQVAEVLSEELSAAQDVMDLFVRGSRDDLEALTRIQPRLVQIVGVLRTLDYDHESDLIKKSLEQLGQVIRGNVLLDDAFLMQMAIAIMTTDQVVAQIGQLITDRGKSLTSIDRVVSEALIPLATACFEDVIASKEALNLALKPTGQPVAPDALENAVRLMAGVRNVLEMAELRAAMPLINGLHDWLSGHVNNLQTVSTEALSALAEVSAAVEFYLENLRDHQKEMVRYLDGAMALLPVLNDDAQNVMPEVSAERTESVAQATPEDTINDAVVMPVDESLASVDDLIAQMSKPSGDQVEETLDHSGEEESVQQVSALTDVDSPKLSDIGLDIEPDIQPSIPQEYDDSRDVPELQIEGEAAQEPASTSVDVPSSHESSHDLDLDFAASLTPDRALKVNLEDSLEDNQTGIPDESLDLSLPEHAEPAAEPSTEWLSQNDASDVAIDLSLPPEESSDLLENVPPESSLVEPDVSLELPPLPVIDITSADLTDAGYGDKTEPSAEEVLSEHDSEMRDVFAEEMQEEVPALLAAAQAWISQGVRESLVTLRRGFHTIKGSSRMVGLTDIGEWGWAYEHLLNQVLDGRIVDSAALKQDVLDAVSLMHEALPLLAERKQPPASYWQASRVLAEEWVRAPQSNEYAVNDQTSKAERSALDESPVDHTGDEEKLSSARSAAFDILEDQTAEQDTSIIERSAAPVSDEVVAEPVPGPEPVEPEACETESVEIETNIEHPVQSLVSEESDGEVIEPDTLGSITLGSMEEVVDDQSVASEAGQASTHEPVLESVSSDGAEIQENELHNSEDHDTTAKVEPIIEDPVLRDIFDQESSGYIHQLQTQIDHALMNRVSLPCDRDLVRLVHTLLGSARTAGVQPIACIADRLEEWVRLLEDHNLSLEQADLAVFQRSLHVMDQLRQWATEPSFDQPDEKLVANEIAVRIDQLLLQLLATESEVDGPPDDYEAVESTTDSALSAPQATPEVPVSDQGAGQRSDSGSDLGISVRPDDLPGELDPDILQIFLEEAEELLEKADGYIAHWRQHPHDLDSIRLLHRNLHTLKGGARMAGLLNLADVTHLLEDRLDRARDRGGEQADVLITLVQHTYDALAQMLDLVKRQAPIPAQVALLAEIANEGSRRAIETMTPENTSAEAEPAVTQEPKDAVEVEEAAPLGQPEPTGDQTSHETATALLAEASSGMQAERLETTAPHAAAVAKEVRREQIRVDADRIDDLVNQVGESVLLQARIDRQVNGYERQLFELQQTLTRLRGQLRRLEIQTESQIKAELMAETGLSEDEFDPLEFDRFTQVQELSRGIMESLGDIASIEEAMSDITEQSQLLLLQQSRLGRKLQDGVLSLRMVRFNDVVGRLRRIVRQVGEEMGRNAELIIHNGETELDRLTIVGLLPSLEHMIRNSLAHGIESPEERRALGKPEVGQIEITIESSGGNVTLEMKDDGRGLDLDAIRRKAVDRKLIPVDIELTDDEARSLIFLPGFSTAGNVSQVAGRGVGMDVVAGAVREMGGFVDLQSEFGKFTRIQLNLPLTQAMTRGILVSVGDNQFAIPYKGVVSVTRMTAVQLAEQYASPKPAVTLNGEQYPLFYLGELLRGEPFNVHTQEAGVRPVFLFKLGERRFAIQVDHQLGGIQLFVKSLGPQLGRIPGLSGATISDDGHVILVLELFELVRQFQRRDDRHRDLTAKAEVVRQRPLVLVVDDSLTVRKVTARTLERNNLDVILARDGVEALGILQDQKPDVVLTDIEMPRMDGFELLGAIRNDELTRDLPVIMISSRTGQKHRSRAEALGVSDYLGKPYTEADLIGRIEHLVQATQTEAHSTPAQAHRHNEEQG